MKLGGVIYLQSVGSNWTIKTRITPFMFRQLCGDNALARVVLGTTHWSEVDVDEGKKREQQLAETFWNDSGSKLRFHQTESSARAFWTSYSVNWNLVEMRKSQKSAACHALHHHRAQLQTRKTA